MREELKSGLSHSSFTGSRSGGQASGDEGTSQRGGEARVWFLGGHLESFSNGGCEELCPGARGPSEVRTSGPLDHAIWVVLVWTFFVWWL